MLCDCSPDVGDCPRCKPQLSNNRRFRKTRRCPGKKVMTRRRVKGTRHDKRK